MDQPKAPIEMYISLSKETKFLLEKLCGISTSENSKERISWIVVLEIINNYLRKHQQPSIIAKKHKKMGSTRKLSIHHQAYPELYHYMDGLMKSQRTFKFDCLICSLEDTVKDISSGSVSDEKGIASEPRGSTQRTESINDIEALMSTEDTSSDKEFDPDNANNEEHSEEDDMAEFRDFMNF